MEYVGHLALAIMGMWFRYNLGLLQACKIIGVAISNSGSDTGFQDAITPPHLTKMSLIIWVGVAAISGWLFFQFAWTQGLIGLMVFFVTSAIAGATFIPKPNSSKFLKAIHGSMIKRYENYEKQNDVVQAKALKMLISRVEEQYDGLH